MRRRDLMLLLGGASVTWPLFARAQTAAKRWRVGLLNYSRADAERVRLWVVFRKRLRELGFVEGDNISFELRWADGKVDRLPALAAELVRLQVDVIATASTPSAQAAKRATNTIPIVIAAGSDPARYGLVESLSRPGGNVTGVATMDLDLRQKRLGLLREMFPRLSRVAILIDANSLPSGPQDETEQAAKALGIALVPLSVRSAEEFDAAFQSMLHPRVDALIIQPSGMFAGERTRLADLAMKYSLPTIVNERGYAEAGCLISYGTDFAENFRRAAEYVAKILKGAKPADLPIEQPIKFELVINVKSAKALGITVPQALLLRADEVIE